MKVVKYISYFLAILAGTVGVVSLINSEFVGAASALFFVLLFVAMSQQIDKEKADRANKK